MDTAKALEVWSAQTLYDIGIMLSILSFLLHLGRPYFDRILSRMTLRVAADIWWISYVVLRDGALLLAVMTGFFALNLDLMADIKIGLPFCPLATVALAAALAVKVFRNTEDMGANFLWGLSLTGLGALLNVIGFTFIMEAPGDEYAAANSTFWSTLVSWRSNANPAMATWSFYLAYALLGLLVIVCTILAIRACRKAVSAEKSDV